MNKKVEHNLGPEKCAQMSSIFKRFISITQKLLSLLINKSQKKWNVYKIAIRSQRNVRLSGIGCTSEILKFHNYNRAYPRDSIRVRTISACCARVGISPGVSFRLHTQVKRHYVQRRCQGGTRKTWRCIHARCDIIHH